MKNKTILITGGTGSFGQAFVKGALERNPAKIIVLSRNEHKQVKMERRFPRTRYPIRYFLGDIRDTDRLMIAFRGVDIVLHAAALKHVDKCHYNPMEAMKTNAIGTANIARAAIDCGVKRVLAISTDKAVNPCNMYGSTKLTGDFVIVGANVHVVGGATKLSVIRFGNFCGSTGSVVPFFQGIKGSGAQPITHMDMTRFFIRPEQAVRRIMLALRTMEGGEIFSPKMQSVAIPALGKAIDPDAKQHVVGLRPGEKLYEELITPEMALKTRDDGLFYVTAENVTNGMPEGFQYNSMGNGDWWEPKELLEG